MIAKLEGIWLFQTKYKTMKILLLYEKIKQFGTEMKSTKKWKITLYNGNTEGR
jgi:hypothetical protein